MSLLLLVDASVQGIAIAFSNVKAAGKSSIVWSKVLSSVGDSATNLPLAYQQGLTELGRSPSDVVGMVASIGPGSFTGIRVGLAYMLGLNCGAGDNLSPKWLGVSTLDLVADEYSKSMGCDFYLCLPSTRTTGYTAGVLGGKFLFSESFDLRDFASDKYKSLPGVCFIVGAWQELTSKLPPKTKVELIPVDLFLTKSLEAMAKKATAVWPTGFSKVPPEPRYLKQSSVEENAKGVSP